ncbi:MAG: penicillin-binding protein [Candidatus Omnitrophica bacterium]|nr:penicillin-binding protein [Candidatus Omnitrophota bacterium]
MSSRSHNARLVWVVGVLSAAFLVIGLQLVSLQILRASRLQAMARSQHQVTIAIPPMRGALLDTHRQPLVQSLLVDSVYADPRHVDDARTIAHRLAAVLDVDAGALLAKLSQPRGFVWLARHITPDQAQRIRRMPWRGVWLTSEPKRFYPAGDLGSHLFGFTDIDQVGLEGLELFYDAILRGEAGWRKTLRDGRGRELWGWWLDRRPAKSGGSLVLSIDRVLQYLAERELDRAYRTSRAKGGTIIILDPQTGAIRALANRPTFDPHHPQRASLDRHRNRAITDVNEPGSVFKMIAASALVEEGLIQPSERIFCENGEMTVAGGHVIHDVHPYGSLTFQEVIQYSSNIGTIKAAQRLGVERLHRYVRAFGFGEVSGVDLPGEVRGLVRPLGRWTKTSMNAVPIGHEVGVTALQTACAMATIANGGRWVKPHLLETVLDPQGRVVEQITLVSRRVVSEATARTVRAMLARVVELGTGRSAKMKSYTAAGKTGTAQKLEPDGRYSHSKFVATFAGFVPAEQPKLVIVVILDEPRGAYYGGVVAAPVFKAVAQEAMQYLEVPPQRPPATSIKSPARPVPPPAGQHEALR